MTPISSDLIDRFAEENTTQVRRASFLCALQTVRLGAFAVARKQCLELVEKSIADADFQNLFASQRLLVMLDRNPSGQGCVHASSLPPSVRDADLSKSALQQRHWLEATCFHLMGSTLEAAKQMRLVCLELGDWRSVDESTSSAFVELATLAREAMLEVARGHETTYNEYERLYNWSMKNAKRVAQKFEQEKPHTYREEAWETALLGGGGHAAGMTLRNLMSSLLRARALGFVNEEINTFVAWDSMCRNYELGVLEMAPSERARYDELLRRAITPLPVASDDDQSATSPKVAAGPGHEGFESSFEDTLAELSLALTLELQQNDARLPFEDLRSNRRPSTKTRSVGQAALNCSQPQESSPAPTGPDPRFV